MTRPAFEAFQCCFQRSLSHFKEQMNVIWHDDVFKHCPNLFGAARNGFQYHLGYSCIAQVTNVDGPVQPVFHFSKYVPLDQQPAFVIVLYQTIRHRCYFVNAIMSGLRNGSRKMHRDKIPPLRHFPMRQSSTPKRDRFGFACHVAPDRQTEPDQMFGGDR